MNDDDESFEKSEALPRARYFAARAGRPAPGKKLNLGPSGNVKLNLRTTLFATVLISCTKCSVNIVVRGSRHMRSENLRKMLSREQFSPLAEILFGWSLTSIGFTILLEYIE